MKIVWRTVKMLLFISVMFTIQMKLADSQSLSICAFAKAGSPCRLTCTTPGVTQSIFFFKLPASGSPDGGCTSTGTCAATNVRYTVTQNSSLSETYLDISSLTYAEDDSQWVCDYGAARSTAVQLTVMSIPTLVQFAPDPQTADLPQTLVGEAYCVYPASSLTVKLVYQDGQTNNTLDMTYPVPTTAGTNGCGSHEFTVTPSYQLTPTTLSGKSVRFWIEVTVAGQVIGSALTTETFVFPASSSSICGSCTPTYVLAALGIVVAVVCVALCWIMFFQLSESGWGNGGFECSVTWCFRATIIVTVIGFILCIAGLIICATCDDSVSSSNSVTVGFALAVFGFVLAVVTLVNVIILVILFCRGVITIKDDGQTIKHVSVKNNAPLTLTCPADDKATKLTWTGPGGTLYVTGTTVEAGFSGSVKRRISASHTGGSYTLTFTKFLPSDMGIYTSKVNGTVDSQMVILEGQTIITPVYVQSNTTLTLTRPADDQATTLTWTGPGGIPYVTGTTVEAGLDDSLKSRVSASHTGGSYTLMFTEFRSSDMGIYTSEVDGIVDTQIVIVQDESTKLQEIIQQVNVCAFALVSTNKRKQKKSN